MGRQHPLIGAASAGDSRRVEALLAAGADANVAAADSGVSPLHVAAGIGSVDVVAVLLRAGTNVDAVDHRGDSPLMCAVSGGHQSVVEALVDAGASVDMCGVSPFQSRALHVAVAGGHHGIVQALLEAGAATDVGSTDYDDGTPLHIAIVEGHHEIVSILLAERPDAVSDSCTEDGRTPLHVAAAVDVEMLNMVLAVGTVDANAQSASGLTPLHIGAEEGQNEIVDALLVAGADASVCNAGGSTPLHVAAENGNEDVVAALLLHGAHRDAVDGDGETPLLRAAREGHLPVVEELVVAGADSRICSCWDGLSPLHVAVAEDDEDMAEILMAASDVDILSNEHGTSPLHLAVGAGNYGMVAVLLRRGANDAIDGELLEAGEGIQGVAEALVSAGVDPNARCSKSGRVPLHAAIIAKSAPMLSALVLLGARLNVADRSGNTPLVCAVRDSFFPGVRILLVAGADPSAGSPAFNGGTPVHVAAGTGHEQILSTLLLMGAGKDDVDGSGEAALTRAVNGGHLSVVKALVAAGASPNIRRSLDGRSPLHVAAGKGHREIASVLIRNGADKNAVDSSRETPLFWATREGHLSVVMTLVTANASPYIPSRLGGRSPLHVAAAEGHGEIVSALLNGGARMHDTDEFGQTPLHWAAAKGRLAAAKILLEAGSNVNVHSTAYGFSPLHLASDGGHCEIVSALLLRGAWKDAIDNTGKTALFAAARRGHLRVVRTLLVAGADFGTRSPTDGYSPLHAAAAAGYDEVVSALLLVGADKNALDNSGNSALSLAADGSRLAVAQSLLAHGADTEIRSSNGSSALERAASLGNTSVMEAILGGGAAVDARDRLGRTALHHAAMANQAGAIDVLISAGAGLELKNLDGGLTPLLAAAESNSHEAMETLLRRGADVTATDDERYTPLHLVCDSPNSGLEAAVGLLLKWNADVTALTRQGNRPIELVPHELDFDYVDYDGLDSDEELELDDIICEIEQARRLLNRAPADRAWRRRGWVTMLRAIGSTARLACDDEGAREAEARGRKVARGREDAGSVGCGNGSEGLGTLVAVLVDQMPEGVFRTVVGFL